MSTTESAGTGSARDLTATRDRLRRAKATEEPHDAADQWAVLGYEVPELVDEIARLRARLGAAAAEVERCQDDRHKAITELGELRTLVLALAEDLERYAADLRPERLPMSERKLAGVMRKIVAGELA